MIKCLALLFFFTGIALDSYSQLVPDDYHVTDKMLKKYNRNATTGKGRMNDEVWLKNDSLKQTLVYSLYTDYHRLQIFHFKNDDIPAELIRLILHLPQTAGVSTEDLTEYIDSAATIGSEYLTTIQGVKLGWKKQDARKKYGLPHSDRKSDQYDVYEWVFPGDVGVDPEDLKKSYAINSFGYSVTTYFRQEVLVAMVIQNDIP